MTHHLLHLIVPLQAEDALVEWLLEREDIPGFTSSAVAGHGSSERSMTTAEQVAGRSRRVMFMLLLPEETAEAVLAGLGEDFGGSGIHYWLVPAIEQGRLV
ncbi:DUF3240 family protein [Thiocapsa marina]|uniref:Nitrogen regulatory protein P-II n=1 Tax=Thiocapsa marina 5811 TaxID=768671 RepID=F9UC75_9GAMM|nr:DUF3240 family protein [Thiocapsa marina]EGV17988.1 hypothetical protein ThimaDRAFT_2527 [Thiocapsa marina 5811]